MVSMHSLAAAGMSLAGLAIVAKNMYDLGRVAGIEQVHKELDIKREEVYSMLDKLEKQERERGC